MEVTIWNSVIVLSKFVFYCGCVCIASYAFFGAIFGAPFGARAEQNELQLKGVKRIQSMIVLALLANVIWFFANTGLMAEEGIQGALDPELVAIMWDSSIGQSALLRSIGLALAIVVLVSPLILNNIVKQSLLMLSLLILGYSFTLFGHIAELGLIEKVLLMLHVMVMMWWFGALYPLKLACQIFDNGKLYKVMEKFSKQAMVLVSLLLFAGLWLALQLFPNVAALLHSSYGQTLLLKLLLVILVLAMGAKHKWQLVPQLKKGFGKNILEQSIAIEMVIAISILLVTAALTSVVGPTD